jgi:BlaI family penicillinase repressor
MILEIRFDSYNELLQEQSVMTRKPNDKPTDSELEILRVLWSNGPSTVRTVHEVLSKTRKVGYTGTLKLMQIMVEKGLAVRDETQRSHVYSTALREVQTQRRLVKELLMSAFSGSADKLVMQALAAKKVTAEELSEIRRMLDEFERRQ